MSATTARKGTKDGELLQHEDCNVETTVSSSIDVAKAPIVQSNIMTNINKNATKSQVANNNIGTSVSNNGAAAAAKGKHGNNNNKGGAPGYPIHPYRATGPPPPTNTTTTQHGGGGGKQQKQKGSKNGSGSGAPPMNMHGIPPPRWNGTFFFVKVSCCVMLVVFVGENMSCICMSFLCFVCTVGGT